MRSRFPALPGRSDGRLARRSGSSGWSPCGPGSSRSSLPTGSTASGGGSATCRSSPSSSLGGALPLVPRSGRLDEFVGGLASPPARGCVRRWLVARLDPTTDGAEASATMSDRRVLRGSRRRRDCRAALSLRAAVQASAPALGASEAEVAGAMPGDELVPEPSFNATRATTIDAPPKAVWPWLAQLDARAGTATTCSTTPPGRAQSGSCRSTRS